MNKMKKYNIFEKTKIVADRTPGYSWCSHCGRTWDKVEYKPILYTIKISETTDGFGGSGMFPVCVGCFNELSSEEILEYCKELADNWKKDGVDINIDFDIIKSNVEYMKKKEE